TVAADRFVRLGDASVLAERLRDLRPDYLEQRRDPAAKEAGLLLSNAANEMTRVSQALQLLRPAETMDASALLQDKIDALSQVTQLNTLPFGLVSDRVKAEYATLAMPLDCPAALRAEARRRGRPRMEGHVHRAQCPPSVGLDREWLATSALPHAGFTDPLERDVRGEIQDAINTANKERQQQRGKF